MQGRPLFLKFGNRWVNLAMISHVDFDETQRTATVFVGSNSVTSKDAYDFFKAENPAFFFTKSVS